MHGRNAPCRQRNTTADAVTIPSLKRQLPRDNPGQLNHQYRLFDYQR